MSQAAAMASARARGTESADHAVESIRLPLFKQWLTELPDASRRQVWLDLGRLQVCLVPHLLEHSARLLVADLTIGGESGSDQRVALDRLLPQCCWNEPLDRVCLWDLLDYLEPENLSTLSAELAGHAGHGCRLHALIQYSRADMPQSPRRLRLKPDGMLEVSNRSAATRTAPRPSPKRLEKLMPEFAVDRTMLLNNGMQEFVLVRK